MEIGESAAAGYAADRVLLLALTLPVDLNIVAFPVFGTPSVRPPVPHITESCMTTHHTETSRREFMCAYSKMVVKQSGRMRVYACTLVDDDAAYDQGATLAESRLKRVMLRHHRCFSCFKYSASCSEAKSH